MSPVWGGTRGVVFHVRTFTPPVQSSVTLALERAQRRLADPACQTLLTRFKDGDGRELRARLEELEAEPSEYLERLLFYDAREAGRCRSDNVLAFTQPGIRVVWICGSRFDRIHKRDPSYAEATLIHEALHTLGLGENPPSSREITGEVLRSCR